MKMLDLFSKNACLVYSFRYVVNVFRSGIIDLPPGFSLSFFLHLCHKNYLNKAVVLCLESEGFRLKNDTNKCCQTSVFSLIASSGRTEF